MSGSWDQGPRPVTAAAKRLLQVIGEQDQGEGVAFTSAPRGRWRQPHTGYTVNDRTFQPLVDAGYVDVGNGHTDPVKITKAGRGYLRSLYKKDNPELFTVYFDNEERYEVDHLGIGRDNQWGYFAVYHDGRQVAEFFLAEADLKPEFRPELPEPRYIAAMAKQAVADAASG